MKEIVTNQHVNVTNNFSNNNGNPSTNNVTNGNNQRKYAVISKEWVSTIGEELGMDRLPDSLLKRLAEDASYRLREVLHKCTTRLKHSKRKRLTSNDVNAVLTNLCDVDPIFGLSNQMPAYHNEAKVFVPHENSIDLALRSTSTLNITQCGAPFIQETEICNTKLNETRQNYAKKALKTLFNGSQKTFQVLLNDCATNAQLGGEGVIDTLLSIARSTVISNNAQYTRVTTRTCQLIISIASNSEAVYPYHLNSAQKLTELLLEILLGHSFINPNVEALFKTCALKLMLRWPSVADKFVPMLEGVFDETIKSENSNNDKRKLRAIELLAEVQPLLFYQKKPDSLLSFNNILNNAQQGTKLWQQIANSVCALVKSKRHTIDFGLLIDHFGDSILPYLTVDDDYDSKKNSKPIVLPIIVRSKIKYASITSNGNRERQVGFPDSSLRGPRREIRFAFAGGRPVAQNNLRRVSLRASYQILRSDMRATTALIASKRLLILRDKKKNFNGLYNLAHVNL
ncbi:hypothetical protein HCN44_000190 [Aphidius gifuensis]|uniref:TATA box binding protein associated factor (TAF) histone-like fold domain-containing protein n=1 Tax=Aphidius gifuensis TaxID=684658 RepID=A0A834XRG8_APHGI|nr:uncharacterized protein LOC122855237 [Aphidius gifuensis]KAF7990385.1 hypothetical protein HCN44_000190 [Aphidius gifuensis]